MKNVLTSIVLILLTSNICKASPNEEFRAVWVITWEHINRYDSAEGNKARVRQILDNVKKANMNAVLWQARQSGTAYYHSSYEPWGYYAGYSDPGYDPLAYAVQEAHKRGIELHAWFNVFQTSSTSAGTPAAEHPEWICTDRDGDHMTNYRSVSPGLQAVREYTVDVAMEIVHNYDIDGFHLDYVRWNEYDEDDMSANPTTVEQISRLDGRIPEQKLQKLQSGQGGSRFIYDVEHPYGGGVPEGFSSWDEWRRWSVTEFVRTLHDSIQKVKPWVRLSPAALGKYNWSGWNGYHVVFQDAALWFNEGYVDQLTPMHYHWLTGSAMKSAIESDWEPNIQRGINAGRLYTAGPGSYILQDAGVWNNHEGIVKSIRQLSWNDGFQFFSYERWKDYNYWEKAANRFFERKTRVRAVEFIANDPPQAPQIDLTKLDSLAYQIQVSENSVLSETDNVLAGDAYWFTIYRSENDQLETQTDTIVALGFGQDQFTFTDQFTGNQDYNGQYRYFATLSNRFRNESSISNAMLSDSIPSFPPQIVETTPAQDEVISIDAPIVLTFSKTIDASSVYSEAFELEPAASELQWEWLEQGRILQLSFEDYLPLDTAFDLTITPMIKDINGKSLDGNGDHVGGDSYVLSFQTKASDDVPPQITHTYPSPEGDNTWFDIQDLISITFNEPLNESTVNDQNIALYQSSNKISVSLLHRVEDFHSVVSLQPIQDLKPNEEYTVLISDAVTDTAGNAFPSNQTINFTTRNEVYDNIRIIDRFNSSGEWWQPDGSGSTFGILVSETRFGYSSNYYLPREDVKKSAYLKYTWQYDSLNPGYLIREYLPPSTSNNYQFDTTYVLQAFVFGDGSHNKFRFCIDENDGSGWTDHEVSKWVEIDWRGWKLIEWDLSDPNSIGSWISSNEELTGPQYRFDSFQLTHDSLGTTSGKIFIENLRYVKKGEPTVHITDGDKKIPETFVLKQNYPNPFNPATTIEFALPRDAWTSLEIFNMLGEKVTTLVDEHKKKGYHKISFNASHLASGIYIYRLKAEQHVAQKRMILIK